MPKITHNMPKELQKELQEALRILHVSQKTLAGSAGVSQAYVSNFINGDNNARSPELAKRFFDTLDDLLKKREDNTLNKEDAALIAGALEKGRMLFGLTYSPKQGTPGTLMDTSMLNFVRLPQFGFINPALRSGPVTLYGPPQTGMTSLLSFALRDAESKGILPVYANFSWTDTPPLQIISQAFQRSLKLDLGSTSPENPASFGEELSSRLNKKSRYLLAMDNVTALDPQGVKALNEFLAATKEAKMYRLMGLPIRDRQSFGIATELLDPFGGMQTDLRWFSEGEVERLYSALGMQQHVKAAWDNYQGQPFLTQQFAFEVKNGRTPDEVYQSQFQGSMGRSHVDGVIKLLSAPEDLNLAREIQKEPGKQYWPFDQNITYLVAANLIVPSGSPAPNTPERTYSIASRFYGEMVEMLGLRAARQGLEQAVEKK